MDWITDQIAIGNFADARELSAAIDAVLCLKHGCCDDREDVDAICIPLVDGSGNSRIAVREAITYIHEVIVSGRRILVHCHAGRSRSVVVVARYLMEYQSLAARDALTLIAAQRGIYLSKGIDELLMGRL